MSAVRAIVLGAVLGLAPALPSPAQELVDLYGVTQATLEWSPASGSVSGYYVIVARDGGTPTVEGVSPSTRATVESNFGESLTVQVAAFDATGVSGPVSEPSSTIRFNALPTTDTTDPTTTTDPAPEPAPDPADANAGDATGATTGTPSPAAHARFDFTGDDVSDLLVRNPRSGELQTWAMQGAQVTAKADLPHLDAPWYVETAADFDGDGGADLLWRNARTGKLAVWLIHDGAVAQEAALDLGAVTRDWKVAAHGDLDGDGDEDIVLARPTLGVVDILFMDGGQVAARDTRSAPSDRWQVAALPDTDGDGTVEIVWENVDSHALAIESMSSPGQAVPLVSQPGDWRVIGTGDLDGDGRSDLLVQNPTNRLVEGWLLDGSQATQTSWSGVPGDRFWTFRGLADFDGDGYADAFWDRRGGVVEIWFSRPDSLETVILTQSIGKDRLVGDDNN
jgi:hypothetical protein